ncbi:hypothetical protein ACINK0_15905 [Deinococcus sp. VB343]|uniref:hypothetical protein n=1 Tax=Deinococcus sp. VB343 TaxID=3385567 RepID=UPI0039C9BF6B
MKRLLLAVMLFWSGVQAQETRPMDVQVAQQTSVALPGDVQLVAGKRQWQAGELEAGAAQATLLVLLPGKGLWFLTFGLSGPEVYMYGEKGRRVLALPQLRQIVVEGRPIPVWWPGQPESTP